MTKQLSQEQKAERDRIVAKLKDARDEVNTAVETYNDILQAEFPSVSEALAKLDQAVIEAKKWTETMAKLVQEEIKKHDRTWLKTEEGEAFDAWRSEFKGAGALLHPLEGYDEPQLLDIDLDDYEGTLQDINEEAV